MNGKYDPCTWYEAAAIIFFFAVVFLVLAVGM